MQDFIHKKIVLGICGGIAAYKSAYLVRELKRLGATVRVIMTQSAQEFITPLSLQALSGEAVRTELFDPQAESAMNHIALARWADYLLIAPASANCLAKFAHGLADDLLSTVYLVAEVPVIMCPAMNRSMWEHPATQANCRLLAQRHVILVNPETGSQACGETGQGRMAEPENIISALRLHDVHQLLQGHSVLITAGPTREALDPVRYFSNNSSGKMGYALAQAALMAGAQVILVSGPTHLPPPPGAIYHPVLSADEMFQTVMKQLKPGMIFIGAAAVADYGIPLAEPQKLKKQHNPSLSLTLQANPDILASVAKTGKAALVVGFSAETQNVVEHAKEKLRAKKIDMIVANQVGQGLGFDVDEHELTVLTQNGSTELTRAHKTRLAGQLIAILAASLQNNAQAKTIKTI